MGSPDRVSVVIPALNEEGGIRAVVERLIAAGVQSVIVADNGSTDGTARIAREAGAIVVDAPARGYGAACSEGLAHVPAEAEWVLFVDADAGTELEALPRLFAQMGGRDLILGNRMAAAEGRAGMTPVQRFGNWLATSLMTLVYGHRYRDLGPLRLIRRASLNRIGMRDRGFGWTIEMQARALECGVRVMEVDLSSGGRTHGKSKISGTLAGSWRAGRAILATLVLCWAGQVKARFAGGAAQRILKMAALAGLCGGAAVMMPHGDFIHASSGIPFFLGGAALMSAGFGAGFMVGPMSGRLFWSVAILARLMLLPMCPGDDVWRYIWEGWIQHHGFDPYLVAPDSPSLDGFREPWTLLFNNPEATAIYPPLAQLAFAGLSAVSRHVLVYKAAFVAADLVCCWLLARKFGRGRALAYAWNPLVIFSFAGGAHYDSLCILAMTAALCVPARGGSAGAAFLQGVSAGFKWVTFPLVFHEARTAFFSRRWLLTAACVGAGLAPVLAGCVWFHEAFLSGRFFPHGFAAYARSAELIPVYFAYPHPLWQHNTVIRGALVTALGGWLLLVTRKREIFAERWLILVLAFSPLVHGWYFTWLAPFGVVTRNLGAILAGVSGFVYFLLQWHVHQPGGMWELSCWEAAALWAPLVCGYAVSLFLRIPRGDPVVVGAAAGRRGA